MKREEIREFMDLVKACGTTAARETGLDPRSGDNAIRSKDIDKYKIMRMILNEPELFDGFYDFRGHLHVLVKYLEALLDVLYDEEDALETWYQELMQDPSMSEEERQFAVFEFLFDELFKPEEYIKE